MVRARLRQHVETEAQMRLAATLRAGLAEGIFNVPARTAAPAVYGAQCGSDHRYSAELGEQAGWLIGVWQVFFDSAMTEFDSRPNALELAPSLLPSKLARLACRPSSAMAVAESAPASASASRGSAGLGWRSDIPP